jgi:phosphonopyruvate decarboxylase
MPNERSTFLDNNEPISEAMLYEAARKIFGFDFVSGLPCGELRGFIELSKKNANEITHLQATNENEATAVAQGAWLANRRPVLYMQNSGLLKATNEIGSLLVPCQTQALFVASWRGAPGETATQHFCTGAATIPIIEALGLPYIVGATVNDLRILKNKMDAKQLPGVILMKKEKFNDGVELEQREFPVDFTQGDWYKEDRSQIVLTRENATSLIFKHMIHEHDGVFSSTGLISRSIYDRYDGPNQFYNAGAFGYTSSIALGFSANMPAEQRTIVVEGDGSILTNLGVLNVIGHHSPRNFVHIVLDNAVYASCSVESTYGSDRIPAVALTFGYKRAFTVQSEEQLRKAIEVMNTYFDGPQMLHVQINSEGPRDFKRPLSMAELANRFRAYFSNQAG